MSQIPTTFVSGGLPSRLSFKGLWNASTNSPTLASSAGSYGEHYRVSTAGNTNLDGNQNWFVDDDLYFNGSVWVRIDQQIITRQETIPTNRVPRVAGSGRLKDSSVRLLDAGHILPVTQSTQRLGGSGDEWASVWVTTGTVHQEIDSSGVPNPGAGRGIFFVSGTISGSRPFFKDDTGAVVALSGAAAGGGGGGGSSTPAFLSEVMVSASNGITSRYNVFDADNYTTFQNQSVVTPRNITYNTGSGFFIPSVNGIFKIDANVIATAASSQATELEVEVNGTGSYSFDFQINSATDPVAATLSVILELTSSDEVAVFIDGHGVSAITVNTGSIMNMSKIAD